MNSVSELEKLQFLFSSNQFSLENNGQEIYSCLSQGLEALDSSCKNVTTNQLNHDKIKIEDNIRQLKQKLQDKEKELEKLQTESDKKIKSYRYEEKLYRRITGTIFELNPPADTVVGYSALKDIKTFEINEKENSQFHITNHLWSLLEKTE